MQFSKIFLPLVAATRGLAAPTAVEMDTTPALVDRQLPPVDLNTCLNGLVGLGLGAPLCLILAVPTLNLRAIASCVGGIANVGVLCPCVNSLPALGPLLGTAGVTC
ncbi:hypothetical protein B0T21DRAFT_436328 [Apiosordaria backusii]|uniref:Hydrophobin n=1 Tax=Apiosordaria backusii TaxID=314023 RepID=A0AA40EIR0_9PEZI|nr:hypothetical protein B0T21DRAFT_436328 [Apiosordaria backusii]